MMIEYFESRNLHTLDILFANLDLYYNRINLNKYSRNPPFIQSKTTYAISII